MFETVSTLILSMTLVAPAFAESFVHDGTTYNFSVERRGEVRLITGEDSKHRRFVLRASATWVDGTVDGQPVSFSTLDVVRAEPKVTVTEVAARN